jgi:hypothetical protein
MTRTNAQDDTSRAVPNRGTADRGPSELALDGLALVLGGAAASAAARGAARRLSRAVMDEIAGQRDTLQQIEAGLLPTIGGFGSIGGGGAGDEESEARPARNLPGAEGGFVGGGVIGGLNPEGLPPTIGGFGSIGGVGAGDEESEARPPRNFAGTEGGFGGSGFTAGGL